MIKCPNCTAELNYDVKKSKVTCKYCGSTFDPKTAKIEVKKAEETEIKKEEKVEKENKTDEKKTDEKNEIVGTYEGKSYSCSQCGATLLTFDETAITFCSYCGSQAMIESKMIKRNNPKYIIPFKKTKEECIDNYRKKLKKSLFAPNYMKDDAVVSKFRGIYIPYCVYKASYHGPKSSTGSVYKYSRGDYKYYDDYQISGYVDSDIDGITFDMVSNLYDEFSHAIPHNYKEAELFNPNYLAGFYADCADVENTIYETNAKQFAKNQSTDFLLKQKEFRKYGCSSPIVKYEISEKNTGMFPLYFLAIRDKENKYVNYAIVNGQTGKVVADIPIDFKKYILISLLIAIPIFFIIYQSNLLLTQYEICAFSIFAAIISWILSAYQMHRIYLRETRKNDKGYTKVKNRKLPKFKTKWQYIIKQIIAICLCVIILILNPVDDYFYYMTAFCSLILVILSFYDLVKEHNLLVATKLPQLEKRGGDESETK